MKLGNQGFGLKEMIIYTCLLSLLLLYVAFSINSLYKNRPEPTINTDKPVSEPTQKPVAVNYEYYTNLENEMKNAATNYVAEHSEAITSYNFRITASTLISNGYLHLLKDQFGEETCSGYINGYTNSAGESTLIPYLKCDNYFTTGYEEN